MQNKTKTKVDKNKTRLNKKCTYIFKERLVVKCKLKWKNAMHVIKNQY